MAGSADGRGAMAVRPGRRVGYVVAALVNLVVLWVAWHLLDWGWPAFLTDEFDELLPVVTVSLVATVVVNLVWVAADPEWFKHLGQLVLNVISCVVAVRTWQVFPFDFSGYSSAWELGTRALIAIGIVGSAIAAIAELVKLAVSAGAERPDHDRRRELRPSAGR